MRFPYNIVQLQFDVDILIYTKKKLDRMLLPTHSHTCMAKRRTKHWHISQWPFHEMIACHYCPFLKKTNHGISSFRSYLIMSMWMDAAMLLQIVSLMMKSRTIHSGKIRC